MQFVITNRVEVVDVQRNNKDKKYAVISITSQYDNHPLLLDGYVAVLRLKFLDIDYGECSLYEDWGITQKDARDIVDFVEHYKDRVDLFIVHCNAGISRSSGTVAALSKIYNGCDKWVFRDARYIPNIRVYRAILEEALSQKIICLPDR
jgi:predicted protein tyrosine phosphatase